MEIFSWRHFNKSTKGLQFDGVAMTSTGPEEPFCDIAAVDQDPQHSLLRS